MDPGLRRPRQRPLAEMNIVPYIDVMLVLLVIFMVTAPMLTQGLKVDLPVAAADPLAVKSQAPIVVSIKADGSLWIRGAQAQAPEQRIAAAQLSRTVKSLLQASPDDTQVLINGDRHIDYGRVVELMAALQQAGIHNVGLLTTPGDRTQP